VIAVVTMSRAHTAMNVSPNGPWVGGRRRKRPALT